MTKKQQSRNARRMEATYLAYSSTQKMQRTHTVHAVLLKLKREFMTSHMVFSPIFIVFHLLYMFCIDRKSVV
jgi:hypothetical protein